MIDALKNKAQSALDSTMQVTNAVAEKTSDISNAFTAKVAEMKDSVLERVNATIAEINLLLPHLATMGFHLEDMTIEVGIPTKLSLSLLKVSDEQASVFEGLLKEHAEKTLFCSVVKLLWQATALANKITFKNVRFSGIQIDIGALPNARIKFLDTETKAN